MARTIKSNALTPGQILIVEGKVYFSRITKRLDGEDLQRDMQSRKKRWLTANHRPVCIIDPI